MDKDLIREGNKKIAEFMGVVVDAPYPTNKTYGQIYHYDFQRCDIWPNHQRFYTEVSVKYHTSWDWLMPVILKIEYTFINGFRPNVIIGSSVIRIDDIEERVFDDDNKIEKVWGVVLSYIQKNF